MSSVNQLKRDFETAASIIPNWQKLPKQTLAENYVNSLDNERQRDAYFAAFCLRYWYRIKKLYDESSYLVNKLHLTYDDILEWYLDSITKVLRKKKFMDPTIFTYVDNDNIDKFINGCVYDTLEKTKNTYYQYYNYDRRKANLVSDSLDTMVEEDGEFLSSEKTKLYEIDKFIKTLIKERYYFEALLVYFIAYEQVIIEKENASGKKYLMFSRVAFTSSLRAFTQENWEYFMNTYDVPEEDLYDLQRYQYCSHSWICMLISEGLDKLKNRSEVKDICF